MLKVSEYSLTGFWTGISVKFNSTIR